MTHIAARRNYDRLSRWYDWFASGEERFTEAGLRLLDPKPDEGVLEIGPGTGRALVRLAEAGARPVGLDLSAGMLARARRTGERSGHAAALCQGDALLLPFPAGTFDAVFMSFTLELFADAEIPALLAECARVLKPSGRLGVVSLAQANTGATRLYEWFHRRWPQMVDCRPIPVRAALAVAGFVVQETQRAAMWGLPVEAVVSTRKEIR